MTPAAAHRHFLAVPRWASGALSAGEPNVQHRGLYGGNRQRVASITLRGKCGGGGEPVLISSGDANLFAYET